MSGRGAVSLRRFRVAGQLEASIATDGSETTNIAIANSHSPVATSTRKLYQAQCCGGMKTR